MKSDLTMQSFFEEMNLPFRKTTWYDICTKMQIPEAIARKYMSKLIASGAKFSDVTLFSFDFIEEYERNINWYMVSSRQTMKKDFVLRFRKNLDLYSLFSNPTFNKEDFNDEEFSLILTPDMVEHMRESMIPYVGQKMLCNYCAYSHRVLDRNTEDYKRRIEEIKKFLSEDSVLYLFKYGILSVQDTLECLVSKCAILDKKEVVQEVVAHLLLAIYKKL